MAEKEVYKFPNVGNYDGLVVPKDMFPVLFKPGRLDDYKLSRKDDVLIATYPRTGG